MAPVPSIKPPSANYKRVALIGYGIIILAFVVLGGWAAVAPLASSVPGAGVVAVEGNRKTLTASLEGGTLRKILVHEGDKVKAGQVLFELDQTVAHANFEIARNQLYTFMAQEARLVAERDNLSRISFPAELSSGGASDAIALRAMADESRQFSERRATIAGQTGILESRVGQFKTEIEGIDRQQAGLQQQVDYLDQEIAADLILYNKGLLPQPRLLAVQRERASIQGSIGRLIADRSKADKGIGETNLQIRQLKQQFFEDATKELTEVRARIAEVRQRYTVATDQAKRVQVTSPVSGSAQSLRVFTEGAAVRPGDPLVDIVPDSSDLIIQAHFSPNDVDVVHPDMTAEVSFPSFHDRTIPVIKGTVHSVSTDRIVDEATRTTYFLAIVHVSAKQLPKQLHGKLIAGQPAQVTVPTGTRTVLQYLTDPLFRALRTGMREQ